MNNKFLTILPLLFFYTSATAEPTQTYSASGYKIVSEDGKATVRLRGYIQADRQWGEGTFQKTDDARIARIRPTFEMKYSDVGFRLTYDPMDGTNKWQYAYIEYTPLEWINARFGKYKAPLGLDDLKSSNALLFMENSLPTQLIPGREYGLMFSGKIPFGTTYQVGIFNGATDNGNETQDADNNKEGYARFFTKPFGAFSPTLQGLGVGIAGSYGEKEGDLANPQLGNQRTQLNQRYVRYNPGVFSNGTHWRLMPQANYYNGPLMIQAEYILTSQELQQGGTLATVRHNAAEVQASYVLTGEDAVYSGWPKVKDPVTNGGIGAWEVGARMGYIDFDDDLFPLFTTPARAVLGGRNVGTAINGYLTDHVKVTLDLEHTDFEGGAIVGDREAEQAIKTRLTVKF